MKTPKENRTPEIYPLHNPQARITMISNEFTEYNEIKCDG